MLAVLTIAHYLFALLTVLPILNYVTILAIPTLLTILTIFTILKYFDFLILLPEILYIVWITKKKKEKKEKLAITIAITKLLVGYNLTLFVFVSPGPSTPPPKEEIWSDTPSEVVHLTDSTFDDFLANNPSVLVMFYAPCKYYCLPGFVLLSVHVLVYRNRQWLHWCSGRNIMSK